MFVQAQSSASELTQRRDEFISRFFTQCNEDTYYFGPKQAFNADCHSVNRTNQVRTGRQVTDCAEMIEFDEMRFRGVLEAPILNTDRVAGVEEKVLIIVDYASSRSRMRVTDKPVEGSTRTTNTHWDPWEPAVLNISPSMSHTVLEAQQRRQPELPAGAKAIGIMIRKQRDWTFYPGPDFPLLGSFTRVFGVNAGQLVESLLVPNRNIGPAAEVLHGLASELDKIASAKPASCAVAFGEERSPALPSAAHGHSMGDTYARLQEIRQDNLKKGVRDDVPGYFVGHRVCYSIDDKNGCKPAPELIYVPGDITGQLNWDQLSARGLCRQPKPLALEVELKAVPHEKRYLDCLTAGQLAASRKRLLDAGVPAN